MAKTVLTGFRMMLAGLICFFCYQYFKWPEGYWSVVTVSAITQATLSDTMVKALLRLLGTCVGAIVGFIIACSIQNNPILLALSFGIFITLTSYVALLTKPYNYGPIVAGFTAVVIISSKGLGGIEAVAWYRTLEVIFGIFIYAIINLLFIFLKVDNSPFFDYQIKSKLIKTYHRLHYSRKNIISALTISMPTTLTYLSWLIWQYPYGFWTTITLLIIMEDTLSQTQGKGLMRLIGQIIAAIFGLIVAFYANGDLIITGFALGAGFFISGSIIGTETKIASVGNHAGSAIAIMLLVGLQNGTYHLVYERFFNVLAGILIANCVMWLYQKYVDSFR